MGHGTDKAIIGGLLGLRTDNYNIKNSFELANEQNMGFVFVPIELDNAHPNTCKLELISVDDEVTTIVGSSIGGGSIVITEINNVKVELKGDFHTLITTHKDKPGMIAKIALIMQQYEINIANMHVLRASKNSDATAIIELDQTIDKKILELLEMIPEINSIRLIKPII
jgi:L-serine dehydratase